MTVREGNGLRAVYIEKVGQINASLVNGAQSGYDPGADPKLGAEICRLKKRESGSKTRLNTYGDALREKLGPAYLSHPEEYNAILNEAKKMGVSVEFRAGTLAYNIELGKPGKFIIDPEASIGALRHENRHMLDDFSLGHPGMRIIADSEKFWELEFRGYLEELNLAREIKDYDAAKFIIAEMRQRRMEILGK